jgi:hypothetical protein
MFVALLLVACAPVTVEEQETVSSERPLPQVVVDTSTDEGDDGKDPEVDPPVAETYSQLS